MTQVALLMEALKSQSIALDDKEARRLERASTDGKIPRCGVMLAMVVVGGVVVMVVVIVMMMVKQIISGQTLLTMPREARL